MDIDKGFGVRLHRSCFLFLAAAAALAGCQSAPQEPALRRPVVTMDPPGKADEWMSVASTGDVDRIRRLNGAWLVALAEARLSGTRMLLQVHDELVFEVPHGDEERAAAVIRDVMAHAAQPVVTLDVPLSVEVGWGANWGVAH